MLVYTQITIIGASLSEPHINGTAVREFYIIIYYYGTSVTRNYISIDALYGPYISRSNLANCKFTLVLVYHVYNLIKQATVPQAQKGGERE